MSWYHFLYDNKLHILYGEFIPIVAKVYNSLKFDKDNKLENIFPMQMFCGWFFKRCQDV